MELAWQHQMSVLTMWLWTSNGHRPLRAPGRPGAMAANPQRQTPLPKDPSDPVVPDANPPCKPPNRQAFYTRSRLWSVLWDGPAVTFHLSEILSV